MDGADAVHRGGAADEEALGLQQVTRHCDRLVVADGERVGIFGPVITRVPTKGLSLQLWDGLTSVMAVPGFWELKRTRTERPEFGKRP